MADSALRWPLVSALLAGAWTAAFLGTSHALAWAAVPLVFAAVLAVRTHPVWAVVALGAAGAITLLDGVRYGGLELLAPSALVLFSVGRRERAAWLGVLGVLVVAGTAACREGLTFRKAVVCTLVFGLMWLFGRLVRRRVLAADAAVAEAERLAEADPLALASPQARAERRRVADESAAALRSTLRDLRAGIDEVLADPAPPDPDALRGIRERGARTVKELRNLLTLLRAEPGVTVSGGQPTSRPVLPGDLALAGAAAVVAGLTLWRVTGWTGHPWIVDAYAGLVLALCLRRTMPVVAAGLLVVAAVPMAIQAPDDPESLLLLAGAAIAHLWVLVNRESLVARVAAAVVAVVMVAIGLRFGADGAGFIAILLASTLGAGRAWGEPDRILRNAEQESSVLRAALERATAQAVHQERLRIARDLHDATSHAVGVVLMQVSKAEALAPTDPDGARAALATARDAGEQARAASDPLLPGVGDDVLAASSLPTEVLALIDQWRGSGLAITADLTGPFPNSPRIAGAIYHVVQEALTNCSRYAPSARITVRIRAERRHLLVEICDDGDAAAAPSQGSGSGLAGLAERVEAAQGHLMTGRFEEGGFRVAARFPVPPPVRSS